MEARWRDPWKAERHAEPELKMAETADVRVDTELRIGRAAKMDGDVAK